MLPLGREHRGQKKLFLPLLTEMPTIFFSMPVSGFHEPERASKKANHHRFFLTPQKFSSEPSSLNRQDFTHSEVYADVSYGTASVLSPERSGLILEFLGCYYFSQLEKGQASPLSGILGAT